MIKLQTYLIKLQAFIKFYTPQVPLLCASDVAIWWVKLAHKTDGNTPKWGKTHPQQVVHSKNTVTSQAPTYIVSTIKCLWNLKQQPYFQKLYTYLPFTT